LAGDAQQLKQKDPQPCVSRVGAYALLEMRQGRDRIDSRKAIARRLGLSESALRNRAQRLRDRLERCLAECTADMNT